MTDSKLCGERDLSVTGRPTNVSLFDFLYLCRSKFCSSVLVASVDTSSSAFGFHVCHIFSMRAEKKMVNADTSRVVAAMANADAVRNWAVVKSPRKSMSKPVFSLVSEASVSVLLGFPLPFDTLANLRSVPIKIFRCGFARHMIG